MRLDLKDIVIDPQKILTARSCLIRKLILYVTKKAQNNNLFWTFFSFKSIY